MKRNTWHRGLVAAVAGLALLVGGVAVASNMGFKFVPNLTAGSNNLSIPWNNNYSNAQALLTDLRTGGDVTNVERLELGKTFSTWDGFGGGVNFPIVKSTGYVANIGTGPTTPTVVGSHDPNFTVSLSSTGSHSLSAPYHQTHSNAQDLLSDLNGFCGGCITNVERLESGKTFSTWDGFGGGVNFSLTLGLAVVVNNNAPLSGYTWPHY